MFELHAYWHSHLKLRRHVLLANISMQNKWHDTVLNRGCFQVRPVRRYVGTVNPLVKKPIHWFIEGDGYRFFGDAFTLNKSSALKPDTVILHPLARGEELSTELDETRHNLYFNQADGAVWNLMSLVILIESCVPTAQNVIMLLLVHGDPAQGQAMALVILYQMLAAIPIFTAWVALFMTLSV